MEDIALPVRQISKAARIPNTLLHKNATVSKRLHLEKKKWIQFVRKHRASFNPTLKYVALFRNIGWHAYTTPEYVVCFSRLSYNFALTSMSLNESPLPAWYHGRLIWFSNGCCCIRYHFLVKISLRFRTAVWYCVTKGKISFFVLLRWGRAWVLSWNFTSERVLLIKYWG